MPPNQNQSMTEVAQICSEPWLHQKGQQLSMKDYKMFTHKAHDVKPFEAKHYMVFSAC